jgi:hypothetical protein
VSTVEISGYFPQVVAVVTRDDAFVYVEGIRRPPPSLALLINCNTCIRGKEKGDIRCPAPSNWRKYSIWFFEVYIMLFRNKEPGNVVFRSQNP